VHTFKYLGSLATNKNNVSVEIKNRIWLGNKCYYGLRKHLGFRSVSLGTNSLNYKTLIRPVVTYGAECWVLTKKGRATVTSFWRESPNKDFWSRPRHWWVEQEIQWRIIPAISRTRNCEVDNICMTYTGWTYSTYEGEWPS
jgi:hypothetical protein